MKFTFINFFSKCCTGHLKCAFDNPEKSFSPENRCVRSMTEDSHSNSFASRNFFWKWSSAQVGYGFENNALLFCWKSKFFLLKDQNWLKKQIFQVNFTIFYLSARWSVVWHTWLNNFAKRQRNHWNSGKDNRKKNFLEREIFFDRNISLEARIFVGWTLKKTFWLNDPFFFISKSEEGWNHVQF